MRHFVIRGCPTLQHITTSSNKRHDFERRKKDVIGQNISFDFLYNFDRNITYSKKN
jgi:hypothetical protein